VASLTRGQIAAGLLRAGLGRGDVVMVHSSLRSMGHVEGGADAVVDALLETIGPSGTLVVPTFTFGLGRAADPVFDPEHHASEMGVITEAVRRRPGARRTRHLTHSFAALGAHASTIAGVQGAAAFACDGPLWQLVEFDARILLLGVSYLRCTFFHIIEYMVQVPYRYWRDVEARVREPDGTERPLPTRHFVLRPGSPDNDLNRLGALLEERGLVTIGAAGNAIARVLRARDVLDTGIAAYRRDPHLLVLAGDRYTRLREGAPTGDHAPEMAVWNADLVAAKRR
jgi:aminoglycoside 3-N-acetyltransferase